MFHSAADGNENRRRMKLKKRLKIMKQALNMELREHKSSFIVYVVLRALVILALVRQLMNQNYDNAFLCLLTLVLLVVPSLIQIQLKIELPTGLEIILLLFILTLNILLTLVCVLFLFTHL